MQQEPVSLLQKLIARLRRPQDTAVDLVSGTVSNAAARATMPGGRFCRFGGCERDQVCAKLSTAGLARMLGPLVRDGRFEAALKVPANQARALNKQATSLIPEAALRNVVRARS